MAKDTVTQPAKRRFFHNLIDSYTVTKRSFPWVGWAIIASTLGAVGASVAVAVLGDAPIMWSITAVMMLFLVPLIWLSALVRKAMYRQIEGVKGCVGAALRQVRRGWIASEEPVAFNKDQDVVWRMIGRSGVVLISEGPPSRAASLLADEKTRTARVLPNVPVHTLQCGLEDGQTRLEVTMKQVYKFPKALSKEEIPAVAARLRSLQSKRLPIPKGIDPLRARPDRKGLRG